MVTSTPERQKKCCILKAAENNAFFPRDMQLSLRLRGMLFQCQWNNRIAGGGGARHKCATAKVMPAVSRLLLRALFPSCCECVLPGGSWPYPERKT